MEGPCDLADLPSELITNILERVPKKSLLESRCVTKRWRRLIDDRFSTKLLLYLFPMFSSSINCIDLRRPDDLVEIEKPFGWARMVLLGSCRGFLCIYNEEDGQVAIWNPSTESCERLPPADAEIAHRLGPPACVYGFGYDDRNEEYVLLRLVQTLEDPIVSAVSIYRSRARVWRRLQGIPPDFMNDPRTMGGIPPYSLVDPRTMGVFLDGCLHWIMRPGLMKNSAKVVVAFDIHTENSVEHLPNFFDIHTENSVEVHPPIFIDDRVSTYLAGLKGRLCLIIYDEQVGVSVSIASENRSGEWHRLFWIANYSMGRVLLQPLAYSENGAQVLLLDNNGTLVWYDLQTKDVEKFHINVMPGFFEAATCFFTESHLKQFLVWLFGGDPLRLYGINSLMDVVEIEYPPWGQQVRLLGSGHHELCISRVDDGQVALWNPTSRSCRLLPPADAEIPHGLALSREMPHIVDPGVYGFGYDGYNHEHVLLRLVQTLEEPIVSAVSIYRSRANVWRQLQGMPYYLADLETMGVFVHDRLHWIMKREPMWNSARVLVAFEFRTERFVEVDLPNFIHNRFRMDLAVLGTHLCLIFYGEPGVVHVWIMRHTATMSGLKRSWELLFSLRDPWWSFQRVQSLGYFRIDRRVLVALGTETRTLGWYNLRTNEVEQIYINDMPSSFVVPPSTMFVKM